ncbi:hypothetical protein [Methylorubrum extorquens]
MLHSPVLRAELEQSTQAALDQADQIIALLDRTDRETGGEGSDAEPFPHAPEGQASQVVWLRGSASDGKPTSREQW